MRGLKRQRSAQTMSEGYALVKNLRRGHHQIDSTNPAWLDDTFTELAAAV